MPRPWRRGPASPFPGHARSAGSTSPWMTRPQQARAPHPLVPARVDHGGVGGAGRGRICERGDTERKRGTRGIEWRRRGSEGIRCEVGPIARSSHQLRDTRRETVAEDHETRILRMIGSVFANCFVRMFYFHASCRPICS